MTYYRPIPLLVSATGCTVQQLRDYVEAPGVGAFSGANKLARPIYRLLLEGKTYKEVGATLRISGTHVRNVALDTAELIKEYHQRKVTPPSKKNTPEEKHITLKEIRYQHYLNLLIKLSEFKQD